MRLAALVAALGLGGGPLPIITSLPSAATIAAAVAQCAARTPSARVGLGPAGIADLYQSDPAVRTMIKASGAKWVRLEINWGAIETAPGVYDWSGPDAILADYATAGISVLGLINHIAGTKQSTWSDIDTRWQAFVTALVTRYGSQIHTWEIFNEPSLPGYGWLSVDLDAAQFWGAYTLLLARASKIIHALDPVGIVVLGGISSGGADYTPIYGYGAAACFDVFAYHPYGNVGQLAAVKSAINAAATAHGDIVKPIWATEIGTDLETSPTRSAFVADLFTPTTASPAGERGVLDAVFLLGMRDSPAGAFGFYAADGTLKSDGALAVFTSLMP